MGKQDLGKANTPSYTGTHVPQWGTIGDKGRQGETRPWEANTASNTGTRGDKGRQDLEKADTPSNTRAHVGRQWETRGDKGRQDLGKADTESNTKADTLRKHYIRTPNSTLFGGKCYAKVSPKLEIAPPVDQTAVSTSTLGFHVAFCEGKSTAAHWAKVP